MTVVLNDYIIARLRKTLTPIKRDCMPTPKKVSQKQTNSLYKTFPPLGHTTPAPVENKRHNPTKSQSLELKKFTFQHTPLEVEFIQNTKHKKHPSMIDFIPSQESLTVEIVDAEREKKTDDRVFFENLIGCMLSEIQDLKTKVRNLTDEVDELKNQKTSDEKKSQSYVRFSLDNGR